MSKVEFTESEWGPGSLKSVRESLKKSAAEIAEKVGLSEQEYLKYESGEKSDLKTFTDIRQKLIDLGGQHPFVK